MSNEPNRRIVQPNPGGGWDITAPKAERVSGHFDRQADAINRGREILENAGGGELQIRGRDGKIRDSDTVHPGRDPHPPRDRR